MGKQQYGYTGVYNATALTLANEEGAAIALDAKGNITPGIYPSGATPTTQSSGNVANAAAVATITGAAAKTTYITGFEITGSGATAGSIVSVTVTGLLGGTATYTLAVATGAVVGNTALIAAFVPALPSSAVNTSIVVTVPALGAGNTNSTVVAHGYTI